MDKKLMADVKWALKMIFISYAVGALLYVLYALFMTAIGVMVLYEIFNLLASLLN